MNRQNLKNISDLEQLESARRAIGKSIRHRKVAIDKDLHRIHLMLKPLNLLGAGWQLVAPSARPLDNILLTTVRRLKKAIHHL